MNSFNPAIYGKDSFYKGSWHHTFPYLKITELIPELLEMLDQKEISFNPAFEVAFLKKDEQKNLLEAMRYVQSAPSLSQAQRIKKLSQEKKLDLEKMKSILAEVKKGEINRVMFIVFFGDQLIICQDKSNNSGG